MSAPPSALADAATPAMVTTGADPAMSRAVLVVAVVPFTVSVLAIVKVSWPVVPAAAATGTKPSARRPAVTVAALPLRVTEPSGSRVTTAPDPPRLSVSKRPSVSSLIETCTVTKSWFADSTDALGSRTTGAESLALETVGTPITATLTPVDCTDALVMARGKFCESAVLVRMIVRCADRLTPAFCIPGSKRSARRSACTVAAVPDSISSEPSEVAT